MPFRGQPLFCAHCGNQFHGDPDHPWCTEGCYAELQWKRVLYIRNKEWYPMPEAMKP